MIAYLSRVFESHTTVITFRFARKMTKRIRRRYSPLRHLNQIHLLIQNLGWIPSKSPELGIGHAGGDNTDLLGQTVRHVVKSAVIAEKRSERVTELLGKLVDPFLHTLKAGKHRLHAIAKCRVQSLPDFVNRPSIKPVSRHLELAMHDENVRGKLGNLMNQKPPEDTGVSKSSFDRVFMLLFGYLRGLSRDQCRPSRCKPCEEGNQDRYHSYRCSGDYSPSCPERRALSLHRKAFTKSQSHRRSPLSMMEPILP